MGIDISLENIILVDDANSFAMVGEEYNLLKIPACEAWNFQLLGCNNHSSKESLMEDFGRYNHIFYALGVINEISFSKKNPVQALRELQFKKNFPEKPSPSDNPFKSHDRLTKEMRMYEKGLELLKEINSKLEFLTEASFNHENESSDALKSSALL